MQALFQIFENNSIFYSLFGARNDCILTFYSPKKPDRSQTSKSLEYFKPISLKSLGVMFTLFRIIKSTSEMRQWATMHTAIWRQSKISLLKIFQGNFFFFLTATVHSWAEKVTFELLFATVSLSKIRCIDTRVRVGLQVRNQEPKVWPQELSHRSAEQAVELLKRSSLWGDQKGDMKRTAAQLNSSEWDAGFGRWKNFCPSVEV